MNVPRYVQIGFVIVVVITVVLFVKSNMQKDDQKSANSASQADQTQEFLTVSENTITTTRAIEKRETAVLPIRNIVPSEQVKYSIPIEEIRQGCSRQDCIPSVQDPVFISNDEAIKIIAPDQIGIALSYKEVERFYPFSMLITKEIVNDTLAGDPLLVTYCPLCGTGIVFDRTVDGVVYEFGVSGMLWQSNLLMYNRSENIKNRNIWSQVLGEAVVGERTGTKLTIIPSDIMQYKTWLEQNANGEVLDTGSQRDPYNGEYFAIAKRFAPNYNEQTSPLEAEAYVYGIEVDGVYKAYPRDLLPEGEFRDTINDIDIIVSNNDGVIAFTRFDGKEIDDVEGFWFSWVAVHPGTIIWQ